MGLVLLDLGDRVGDAVELEAWSRSWHITAKGVCTGIQV